MSGEEQIWERYQLDVSEVEDWPSEYEDTQELINAEIHGRNMHDGSLRLRIIGPDDDVLNTITENIASELAASEDRGSVAYIEVDLTSLDVGDHFSEKDERDEYIRQQVEDKQQQLGDAMLASQVGPTTLVLQHVNAVPGKWQASFFSVLENHYCRVSDGAQQIEGEPDNLVIVSTMRSDYDGYDFDLKFARLMGSTHDLEKDRDRLS